MTVSIEQLGWPSHAADEKGVTMWRKKLETPTGEVIAKLGRFPDGISCEIQRFSFEDPAGVALFHKSEWTLDGQLKSFTKENQVMALDEAAAQQDFIQGVQLLNVRPSYNCHGRLPRVEPTPLPHRSGYRA